MNSLPRPSFSPGDALGAPFSSLFHHLLTARLRLPEFAQSTAGHLSAFACSQNRGQVPP